jgi:hypothetical protein
MRKSVLVVLTLVVALGIGLSLSKRIQAQARPQAQAQPQAVAQPASGPIASRSISQATLNEYLSMVEAKAGEAQVRSWARTKQLDVASLGDQLILFPEPPVFPNPPEEAGVCDPKKCPNAAGYHPVQNSAGKVVGYQQTTCTASACKWSYNQQLKSWTRLCGGWRCTNAGGIISRQ